MNESNWEEAARNLLQQEKQMRQYNHPEPTSVMVEWKNGVYFGSIQQIALDYSKEIVLLSKSSNPLQDGLVNAIRKLNPERLDLYADDSLDLVCPNNPAAFRQ